MNGVYFLLGICGFLFILFLFGLRNAKAEEKRYCNKLKKEFGQRPDKRLLSKNSHISGYHEKHKGQYFIDDITFSDLSMTEVFDRINYCESSSGEEYLYYMLRNPRYVDDFDELENELKGLFENEEERIRLKSVFHKIGKSGKYSIYDYLELLSGAKRISAVPHYLALALMVASIIYMSFVNFTVGFIALLAAVSYNIVTYFKIKAQIEPYLVTFAYICRLIIWAKEIAAEKTSAFSKECEELKSLTDTLGGFSRNSWIVISGAGRTGSGNPLDIIADYVRMITHIDLIKFGRMFDKLEPEKGSVDRLITIMGKIDATLAICYYRASLDGKYCRPVFVSDDTYKIEDGYHPLLDSPVPNSIVLNRGLLLTGSNASGKSTFLKMSAINSIFAQTIHTCTAVSYTGRLFRIYSSMALRDDLNLGDSYYMAEIKSLKRVIDAARDKVAAPVLCFVDEVLRGTNTTERIAASSMVLDYFTKEGVFCFAATHDGELCSILADKYDIYHFEGDMTGGDVIFDYRLRKGPATTRNAIKLLESIGYDKSIVEDAEAMAEYFDKEGIWKRCK
jgi:hypothetical protein